MGEGFPVQSAPLGGLFSPPDLSRVTQHLHQGAGGRKAGAMNDRQIKEASAAGNSNFEVLQMVIDAGSEFPDAQWKVTKALGLKPDEAEQMVADYDECA